MTRFTRYIAAHRNRLLRASYYWGRENRARIAFQQPLFPSLPFSFTLSLFQPRLWCTRRRTFSARQSVREFRDIVSLSIPPIKRHVYSATRSEHGQKPRRSGYLFSFRKVNPQLGRDGDPTPVCPILSHCKLLLAIYRCTS